MRQRDDLMLMHQQDPRLIRLGLMQLNERVQRCCGIGAAESAEPPSKKMRRGHYRCGLEEHRRPSEPRRRVRFAETNRMAVLPCRDTEDVSKCWHTKSDVANFKRRARLHAASLSETKTAKLMRLVTYLAAATHVGQTNGPLSLTTKDIAGNLGDRIDAARGVEHLVCPTISKLLIYRRKLAQRRVLEEQSRIERRSAFDSSAEDAGAERIARAAREASSFSREWTRRVLGLHREAP